MAQGFAQGFTSGFGLVSDVFKEKRQAEAQAQQMAFQREQFEEQKRRSAEASELAKAQESRLAEAAGLQRKQFLATQRKERIQEAIQTGDVAFLLADETIGPQLVNSLNPEYRDILNKMTQGKLNLDDFSVPIANAVLSSEILKQVGQEVTLKPDPNSPGRSFRTVTVTNKSITGITPVEGNPNLVTIDMLVEAKDKNGRRVVFQDKMTAGRQVGGDPKQIPVRDAINYLTVGKTALHQLISSQPQYRNMTAALLGGNAASLEAEMLNKANTTYADLTQKMTSSLQDELTALGSLEEFKKKYQGRTPREQAEFEVRQNSFMGMSPSEYVSSLINRYKGGDDVSKVARMPNLDVVTDEYKSSGVDIKSREDAVAVKNVEYSVGDVNAQTLKSLALAYSQKIGRPITIDELKNVAVTFAEQYKVVMKGKPAGTAPSEEDSQVILRQTLSRLPGGQTQGEVKAGAADGKSFLQKSADVVGGGISGLGSAISAADPLGLVGLREGGRAISGIGERVSAIGDAEGAGVAEKKSSQTAVDPRVSNIAPAKYATSITSAAKSANIDPVVLAKIAKTESSFREDVVSGETVSRAGAVGIVQMIPKWHKGVDFERVKKDPAYALNEGAKYFRELLDMYGGDYQKAAAAYNWGPGNLSKLLKEKGENWKAHLPSETKNYLKKVFA